MNRAGLNAVNRNLIFYMFAISGFFLELFRLSVPAALKNDSETRYSLQYLEQAPFKSEDQTRISEWNADVSDDDHDRQDLPQLSIVPELVLKMIPSLVAGAPVVFHRPNLLLSPSVSSQGPPSLA